MKIPLLILLLLSPLAYGIDGDYGAGNGGDECENEIKSISEDIKTWIENDGPKHLDLKGILSLSRYKEQMLDSIQETLVSCPSEKVHIGAAEKTCINFIDSHRIKRIKCNYERMSNLSVPDKYKLIHHEYAGVAKIETNKGNEESDYRISNQLSAFLEDVTIKKLALKPRSYEKINGKYVVTTNNEIQINLSQFVYEFLEKEYKRIKDNSILPRSEQRKDIDPAIYTQENHGIHHVAGDTFVLGTRVYSHRQIMVIPTFKYKNITIECFTSTKPLNYMTLSTYYDLYFKDLRGEDLYSRPLRTIYTCRTSLEIKAVKAYYRTKKLFRKVKMTSSVIKHNQKVFISSPALRSKSDSQKEMPSIFPNKTKSFSFYGDLYIDQFYFDKSLIH